MELEPYLQKPPYLMIEVLDQKVLNCETNQWIILYDKW